MDGILLIDKKEGMTSRDCVNQLMRKFNMRKVGHTGTLDPFATGLLIITFGKATKAGPFIEDMTKTYRASLKLGVKTDTLDWTGNIIDTKEVPLLDEEKIKEVFDSLKGELQQVPPMYSALKYKGEPLYKYAREGIEIERKSRTIQIYDLVLLNLDKDVITFQVTCSKGTYVRTLGEQIAECLNTYGHLVALRRIAIGKINVEDAKTLEEVTMDDLCTVSYILKDMPTVVLDDEKEIKNVKDGKMLTFMGEAQMIFIKDNCDNPLAVYIKAKDNLYRSLRGLF